MLRALLPHIDRSVRDAVLGAARGKNTEGVPHDSVVGAGQHGTDTLRRRDAFAGISTRSIDCVTRGGGGASGLLFRSERAGALPYGFRTGQNSQVFTGAASAAAHRSERIVTLC
eukprot:COSAG02_NODE_107_length_36312_cov_45.037942_23_plen_114_part_00